MPGCGWTKLSSRMWTAIVPNATKISPRSPTNASARRRACALATDVMAAVMVGSFRSIVGVALGGAARSSERAARRAEHLGVIAERFLEHVHGEVERTSRKRGRVLVDHQDRLALAVLAEDGLGVVAGKLPAVAPAHAARGAARDAEPVAGTGGDDLARPLRDRGLQLAHLSRPEQLAAEQCAIEVGDIADRRDDSARSRRE